MNDKINLLLLEQIKLDFSSLAQRQLFLLVQSMEFYLSSAREQINMFLNYKTKSNKTILSVNANKQCKSFIKPQNKQ